MGEVQTWSLNKREATTRNTYVSDIRNARMLAFDWLGQCLYWAGKANTVGVIALQKREKNIMSTRKTVNEYLGR